VRYVPLEALDVRDPDTLKAVPWDGESMGEVMFRGNVVMKGYLKNKSATEKAFAGGWFHSGDLGVMHRDGYIQLKDRSKDLIISGGENISSIEVEDALYKHPAVGAAAVVAKPDDKWGETPCAFIELKPGQKATRDDIIAWCRKNLAGYKCPRYVVFTELPRTSTGKIQKFKQRDMPKALRAWQVRPWQPHRYDSVAPQPTIRIRSCCATPATRGLGSLRLLSRHSAAVCRRPRWRSERSIHSRVSFSCTPFWLSRARRLSKSTRSRSWSWLKQENTTLSTPLTGSRCTCRHCAQIPFIMHCIGELMEAIALCPGLRCGASIPCRAWETAAIMPSEPMAITRSTSPSGIGASPSAPDP